MNCPRCHVGVSSLQNACPECGFSAAFLQRCLGSQWVRLDRITDVAHCLRLEDSRQIEVALDDFERNFPQAFFAAYLGVLPNTLNVSELGFWLLNQGAFNTRSVNRRNDFGIVMVVDPAAKAMGLTLGYAIETFFQGKPLRNLLHRAGDHLRAGSFGAAIETTCRLSGQVLRKHGHRAIWQPDISSSTPGLGLQPLREGHRTASRSMAGFSRQS